MAFRRDFAKKCYRVPEKCPWDMWLGCMAPFYGDVIAINEKMVFYRQQENNNSYTLRKQNRIKGNRMTRICTAIKKPINKYFFDSIYFGESFLDFIKNKNTNNKIYSEFWMKPHFFIIQYCL